MKTVRSIANSPSGRASRRALLRAAAAAPLGFLVPRHVLGGPGQTPPSDVVTYATIGCGVMGTGFHVHPNQDSESMRCLAVCDVDRHKADAALAKAGQGCTAYQDFRRVLDRPDVDVVRIVTPPHWHALMTVLAAKAGKDILCEKPMTQYMREGPVMARVVRRYRRICHINSYGHGPDLLRNLVDSGVLGTPLTIRHMISAGAQGLRSYVPQPIPPHLDYELWLGPAPWRPFHPFFVTPGGWRSHWDFGGGSYSDWAQHWLSNIFYWLDYYNYGPVEVETDQPWPTDSDAIDERFTHVTYRFEDGTRIVFLAEKAAREAGQPWLSIEGPKGKCVSMKRGTYVTEPEGLLEAANRAPPLPRLVRFWDAVRTRVDSPGAQPTVEQAHRTSALIHAALISMRLGRKLRWDPAREEFPADEQANRMLDGPMRAPWSLC